MSSDSEAQAQKRYSDADVSIRPAKREDMATVAKMIQDLADFEKMPGGPKMSVEELERDGFEASPPLFRCSVAELRPPAASAPAATPAAPATAVNPAPVLLGYALYFPTYSTWEGRSMMLEDLYVAPSERRRGVGRKLFAHVAKEASSSGCNRLDFHVLRWNDARRFYESKGAVDLTGTEQWCYYRLQGDALDGVARSADAGARAADRSEGSAGEE